MGRAISSGGKLVIPDHVIARLVGSEAIILNLQSGTYHGLDAIGARVWTLVAEGQALPEVIATMLAEFDVTEERLTEDVRGLLDGLVSRGLLEVQP